MPTHSQSQDQVVSWALWWVLGCECPLLGSLGHETREHSQGHWNQIGFYLQSLDLHMAKSSLIPGDHLCFHEHCQEWSLSVEPEFSPGHAGCGQPPYPQMLTHVWKIHADFCTDRRPIAPRLTSLMLLLSVTQVANIVSSLSMTFSNCPHSWKAEFCCYYLEWELPKLSFVFDLFFWATTTIAQELLLALNS